jgi:hypothetical protein
MPLKKECLKLHKLLKADSHYLQNVWTNPSRYLGFISESKSTFKSIQIKIGDFCLILVRNEKEFVF